MTTELLNVPLELRFVDDDPGYLEGIVVPYGETTHRAPGQPRGERFLAGAFARSIEARAASVRLVEGKLVDNHLDGIIRRPYGVAVELRDLPAGLWGRFRFYNTPTGQEGRAESREGTYKGLSVGFKAVRERRGADGAREVVEAQFHHAALVDDPAYEGAKILAVRAAARSPYAEWTPPEIVDIPNVFAAG